MRILFVCLHNAGRSQITQALFEQAVASHHDARSAGTVPGDRVHPEVVDIMVEEHIDLSRLRPQRLSVHRLVDELEETADATEERA